jgi:hypothetical protein
LGRFCVGAKRKNTPKVQRIFPEPALSWLSCDAGRKKARGSNRKLMQNAENSFRFLPNALFALFAIFAVRNLKNSTAEFAKNAKNQII